MGLPLVLVNVYLGLAVLLGATILLLVWYCTDSGPDNQYGPSPKGAAAYPPPPAYGSGAYGG